MPSDPDSVSRLIDSISRHLISRARPVSSPIRTPNACQPFVDGKTRFTSQSVPGVSVKDYLARLYRLCELTPETLLVALIYVDRFLRGSAVPLTVFEVHRLLGVACVEAAKFHFDDFYDNVFYAKAVGIRLRELNSLEEELLEGMEYRMLVTEEDYQYCLNRLEAERCLQEEAASAIKGQCEQMQTEEDQSTSIPAVLQAARVC